MNGHLAVTKGKATTLKTTHLLLVLCYLGITSSVGDKICYCEQSISTPGVGHNANDVKENMGSLIN